ncbi:MAG: DNA gyrase/topoisomerase IV subunit A [Sakamotonia sp.]|jgi:DNA gyrase subunit A
MAEKILRTEYSEEMQKSYLDYSMSVITARAIPDARDGLKPVQRRVLYDMSELHLDHDKPHRKSARIVGDTMGKYHPHGDSSIYETLVVMSQDFKKGMALVDGHGNFGSIEGDGAAAMRYTEARLKKFAEEVYLKDLDKTVDFVSNYDETETEPEVLPVRVPNLLINGAEGIAVGMSTSIPPHNLGEVVDAVKAYIDNRLMTVEDLMQYLPGPDFPTGGIIANKKDLLSIYETGAGKLRLRGKIEVELGRRKADRDKLVITEIPYTMIGAGINKFLSDVADLVESRKLPDVVDISNQSSKEGIRIVLELKKDADVNKIRNLLYKKTKLEDTYGVNMLAIDDGRPETMNLKQILNTFLEFQYKNMTRKYNVLLEKELEKKEVQEGLIGACDVIDVIIAVLRGSKNLKDARDCLMTGNTANIKFRSPGFEEEAKKLCFTERQASAILEMRLYKLIGLEILALQKAYKETLKRIREYRHILSSQKNMDTVIKEDLDRIREEFAGERRTVIEDGEEIVCQEEKEAAREMIFAMDRFGYCKLLEKAVCERNPEAVQAEHVEVVPVMTDDRICFFTDTGSMYQAKAADVPVGKLKDKGVPLDNISRFEGARERILLTLPATELPGKKLLFATEAAMLKIVPGEEFLTANRMVAATKLSEGDQAAEIRVLSGETEIVLQTKEGMFLRFTTEEIPELKKNSRGVRGMKLENGDRLEHVYFPEKEPLAVYKEKEVHLNRLRMAKRDGKGTKTRI